MRWLKSPAPSRCAPARSALIGTSIRRAMMVPAMIAVTRPIAIRSAIRTSWSRIGVSACAVGCSKNTNQPIRGTALTVVSTSWPAMSVPSDSSEPLDGGDLRQAGEILADFGALRRTRQHLALAVDDIGKADPADLGIAEEILQEAQVDFGDGDLANPNAAARST